MSDGFFWIFIIRVPKSELAQANQLLVNLVGSSFWNDSCIHDVPAVVYLRIVRHSYISKGLFDVIAKLYIIQISFIK